VIESERLVRLLARTAPRFEGSITPDTPLTEDGLGFDSLALAALIGDIEDEFAIRVREQDIGVEAFATVGCLLRFLEAKAGAPASSSVGLLKMVQPGSGRAPLIIVNGDVYGNGALYCVALARALGPERPVYSLSSHGTDGGSIPPSIEEMAADHCQTVSAAHPDGPYVLAGYSHGALVAFEMARQLTASARRVLHVFVIDMAAVQTPVVTRVTTPLRRIAGMLRAGRRATRTLAAAARGSGSDAAVRASPATAETPSTRRSETWRRQQWATYARIVRAYVPRSYPGPVTVLVARDGHYRRGARDRTLGWAGVAGPVRTATLPGDHLTCVTTHTSTLARHIVNTLARYGPV
jgi:thioesterase domain-containing protein/acyl carrier protein